MFSSLQIYPLPRHTFSCVSYCVPTVEAAIVEVCDQLRQIDIDIRAARLDSDKQRLYKKEERLHNDKDLLRKREDLLLQMISDRETIFGHLPLSADFDPTCSNAAAASAGAFDIIPRLVVGTCW